MSPRPRAPSFKGAIDTRGSAHASPHRRARSRTDRKPPLEVHDMARMISKHLLVGLTALLAVLVAAAAWAHPQDPLKTARAATSQFRNLDAATHAQYGLFLDKDGIACIAQPPDGAMGVHYVNGSLLDTTVDPAKPEAVVYEPRAHGKPQLVALEYIVFKAPWDAHHDGPPELFGEKFMTTNAPNRFNIDPFYSLHAWIFKRNPAGMFAMWNPRVHCDGSDHGDDDMNAMTGMAGMNMP